ncbi:hypothetical protein Ancab_006869 [Ancistrocladus abbreviatus]
MSLILFYHPPPFSSKSSSFHFPILFPYLPNSFLFIQNPKPFRATATGSSSASSKEVAPKSAIQRIAEKLRNLGFVEETNSKNNNNVPIDDSRIGEIFIPHSERLPKHRVGHTLDRSWSTPENPVPEPGRGRAITKFHELRGEVLREKRELKERERREKVPTLAELMLPAEELRRLRTIGIKLKKKLKVGKAGITEGILNGIHERWRNSEVVKIVCEDICKMNMKRTHDFLEMKTGGMVVWRAGSKIVLYRGVNYKYPYFTLNEASTTNTSHSMMTDCGGAQGGQESNPSSTGVLESSGSSMTRRLVESSLIQGVGSPNRVRFLLPGEERLVEEADVLLDGLGPRFTDWWGYDPLPIDADLLPAVVPGYRRPFRLLPYGVNPKLTNDEMTILKRLGRPLPCHFALGRNRNLQGLAAAIVKLWEKCEIAKIAVKRGVQNTNSELMAEELKRLTGGILLSRDKEFVVFYRGKDFLPSEVSLAIEERRKSRIQDGRQWMHYDSSMITTNEVANVTEEHVSPSRSGRISDLEKNMDSEEKKMKSIEAAIARTSINLSVALEKKNRAEKLLADLEQAEVSKEMEVDKEGITEEERFMLRKVGLKMKPFLLLGRRGVFDGTVENMHLHWKYRELVKIICGGRSIGEVHRVAQILEAESGGILVAVERVRKGHAIIVYRGKNYQRPTCLRPRTLLNKKEAKRRFIEAQRRESLQLHVLKLTRNVEELSSKLVKDKEVCSMFSGDMLKTHSVSEDDGLTPMLSNNGSEPQKGSLNIIQQDKQIDISSTYEDKESEGEDVPSSSPGSECVKIQSETVSDVESDEGLGSTARPDNSEFKRQASCYAIAHSGSHDYEKKSAESSLVEPIYHELRAFAHPVSKDNLEHHVSDKIMATGGESANGESTSSFSEAPKDKPDEVQPRATSLSNKERLLLRKQALMMKKRPVLAVGRSNVITGVAKAIKEHFKKHPLAIVNVKGRAKGTSVQEVVSMLEQATGGVLVSQEPSKVILYRGWGSPLETGFAAAREDNVDEGQAPAVSPELMAAMRLECGLPSNGKDEAALASQR